MKQVIEGMGMVLQKQVYNGTTGYNEQQGQKADMSADELNEAKQEADIYADLHPEKYGVTRTIKGMDKVNDKDAYIVEVMTNGKKSTEYYDVASGLLVKQVSTQESEQGAITISTEFSDYKEVPGANGYKIPYTLKQSFGPQTISGAVQTVEINKSIADTEFN